MASVAALSAKRCPIKHLLVLDFEATCGDSVGKPEIIEFPTLVYDFHEGKFSTTLTNCNAHASVYR